LISAVATETGQYRWLLRGVISKLLSDCGSKRLPTIAADVVPILRWISDFVNVGVDTTEQFITRFKRVLIKESSQVKHDFMESILNAVTSDQLNVFKKLSAAIQSVGKLTQLIFLFVFLFTTQKSYHHFLQRS
jgi:hypothetical protein